MANPFDLMIKTQNGTRYISDIVGSARHVGTVTMSDTATTASVPSGWSTSAGVWVVASGGSPYGSPITISGSTINKPSNYGAATILFFLTADSTISGGYGIYARNNNNIVIVDANFKAMQEVGSGTSTGVARLTFTQETWDHTITVPAADTLVFGKFEVDNYLAMSTSGTSAKMYSRRGGESFQTVPYVLARYNAPVPDSDYGLQIFNDDGVRIFDSAMTMLEILAADTVNITEAKAGITIPAATTHIFVKGIMPGLGQNSSHTPAFQRTSSTRMVYARAYAGDLPPQSPQDYDPPAAATMSYICIAT